MLEKQESRLKRHIFRSTSVRFPFVLRSVSVRSPFGFRSSSVRSPFRLRYGSEGTRCLFVGKKGDRTEIMGRKFGNIRITYYFCRSFHLVTKANGKEGIDDFGEMGLDVLVVCCAG